MEKLDLKKKFNLKNLDFFRYSELIFTHKREK